MSLAVNLFSPQTKEEIQRQAFEVEDLQLKLANANTKIKSSRLLLRAEEGVIIPPSHLEESYRAEQFMVRARKFC